MGGGRPRRGRGGVGRGGAGGAAAVGRRTAASLPPSLGRPVPSGRAGLVASLGCPGRGGPARGHAVRVCRDARPFGGRVWAVPSALGPGSARGPEDVGSRRRHRPPVRCVGPRRHPSRIEPTSGAGGRRLAGGAAAPLAVGGLGAPAEGRVVVRSVPSPAPAVVSPCPARPRCPRRRRMGPSHSSPPPSARRRLAAAAATAAALATVAAPLLLLPLLRLLMPLLPLLLPPLLLMPVLLLPLLPPLPLLLLLPPRRDDRRGGVALGPHRASGRGSRREGAIHRSIHRTHGNP